MNNSKQIVKVIFIVLPMDAPQVAGIQYTALIINIINVSVLSADNTPLGWYFDVSQWQPTDAQWTQANLLVPEHERIRISKYV